MKLEGKTALITGGGRGIGKAIAKRYVEAGANVVIASRKMEVLEATARELSGGPGRIHPVACHVGRKDQIEALVAETGRVFGPVDILVNNSGTNVGQGPALEVTDEALLKTTEVNVLAALRLIRLTVPKMIERGGAPDRRLRGGSFCAERSFARPSASLPPDKDAITFGHSGISGGWKARGRDRRNGNSKTARGNQGSRSPERNSDAARHARPTCPARR